MSNHILCNCLPPHINLVLNRVHTTLLQHLVRGWIDPLAIRTPMWCVLLCHRVRQVDVKSLKSGHDSWAQDPHVAPVQGGGLQGDLVELGPHPWRQILLPQHMSKPCPRALQSWLCTAWMSLLSCKSRWPRYQNTSTHSNLSPQSIANHGTHGCVPRSARGITPQGLVFCHAP